MNMNYQNNKIVSFLVFAFVAITLPSNGQTFYGYQGPDIIRAAQLIQNRSFLINPNQLSNDEIDSILNVPVAKKIKLSFADFEMSLAPLQYISVFSSTIPSNFSQGTLVPNVGVQTLFTAGFNLKWTNKITLQFVPEFQRGQNKPFPKYPTNSTDWTEYYHYLNNLDLPAQFGETQLNKYSLGQSSAIFHWKTFDIGLSTANKWWGPASFNPIILGSNAQGFAHGTVSTRRPIKTFIGNIEGEAIVGLLEQSRIYPPETNRISTRYNEFLYKPKKTTNRYLTGLVYTLQPKWVPGLYIGLARTSMMYKDEMNNVLDLLPFGGLVGVDFTNSVKLGKKAAMGSWFMRYVMPSEKAEIYYEYGRNDRYLNIWNVFQKQSYGRGFTGGFKKAFEINRRKKMLLQLGVEITTLSLPDALQVFEKPNSWYLHQHVRQGFTNRGKILGAGIGPGSNSQTLFLQWMRGLQVVGIRVNRVIHNLDFYHSTKYYQTDHFNQYWATVSSTAYFSFSFKKITLAGEYSWQRDLNYQWEWYRYTDVGFENIGNDIFNTSGRLLLRYRL
jgi:hypothetical protein